MDIYSTRQRSFHLDPRTKLLLMAVISTAEFLYNHTAFMIAVAVIPFILLMINKQFKLGIGFILLLFPAFAMGAYMIYSTKASEFITAMSRMHVTRKITIPVSVLFRFLPTMHEESVSIKDAMRMREIQFGTKKFWRNPLALIEYRFIPLMISTVKIGDELSAAALTRGLDNPVARTNITEIGFTFYDLITLLISAIMLSVSFFVLR